MVVCAHNLYSLCIDCPEEGRCSAETMASYFQNLKSFELYWNDWRVNDVQQTYRSAV